MGAGASALPDRLSLEDCQKVAGDKFDIAIFKQHCDEEGMIPRDVFIKYEENKKIVHASTMPPGQASKLAQLSPNKLTQAESMKQLWRKATGLNRPVSVRDMAVGFILTKRAAWSDPTSAPLSPNGMREPGRRSTSKQTNIPIPIDEAATPSAKHHKTVDHDDALGIALNHGPSATSYDESMDSNDSLLQNDSRKELLDRSPSIEETKTTEENNKQSLPNGGVRAGTSLRLNLATPLTLDLDAPPADRRGLTLMTDTVGSMRAGGSMPTNDGVKLGDRNSIRKLYTGENSYSDLLDGVDDVIDVDDDMEESFIMTPRKGRGVTLNVNLDSSNDCNQDKSMMFTASGAIELKGIDLPIRDTGMINTDTINENHESITGNSKSNGTSPKSGARAVRLPLQDRAVRLEKLGQGAAGIVYKAFDLEGLELVALKEIPIYEKVKRHQMVHELNSLHRNLRSSNDNEDGQDRNGAEHVVAFVDAFSNLKDATVNLMVEYMNGGSLQNIVDSGGCEDHLTLANIAKQSLYGLRFLHNTQNLHRDIKPANMLINFEGDVKISDFGIIRKLEHQVEEESGMMDPGAKPKPIDSGEMKDGPKLKSAHTFVGTVTFMSPERINGESYSTPSDVWSLGLSLMTCALGKIPLRTNKGYWSLLQCVRDEDPPTFPIDDLRWSDDLKDFCKRALIKDPKQRATCDELLKHPFLKQADVRSSYYNNQSNYSYNNEVGFCMNDSNSPLKKVEIDKDNKIIEEEVDGGEEKESEKQVEESKSDVEAKDTQDTPSKQRRERSPSTDARVVITDVLREGAQNELDALLRGLYKHIDGLFQSSRQGCLALLDKEASQSPNAMKALEILLRPNAQPRRKVNYISSMAVSALTESSMDGQSLPQQPDVLERLASQLNLPVRVVRRRVDLLTREGIMSIARKSTVSNLGSMDENKAGKNILFDTLDSSMGQSQNTFNSTRGSIDSSQTSLK